jgi:hypothetical protein
MGPIASRESATRKSLIATLGLFLVLFAPARSARAGRSEDLAAAQEAARQAAVSYAAGLYEEAVDHYRRAYRLVPDPTLLLNIGQSLQLVGRPEEALIAYRSYLRTAPADAAARSEIQKRVDALEQGSAGHDKGPTTSAPIPPVASPPVTSAPIPPAATAPVVSAPPPAVAPTAPAAPVAPTPPVAPVAPTPPSGPAAAPAAQQPPPRIFYDPTSAAPFPGTIHGTYKNWRVKSGTLEVEALIGGIVYKAGDVIAFDRRGDVQTGTLAGETVVDRNTYPAGTRVWFHKNGHMEKVVLSSDWVVQGDSFRAGTTLAFYESGELEKASLSADTTLQGVVYEQFRRERANVVGFYKNGKVKEGRLAIGTQVQGIKLRVGTFVKFHENGSLSYGTLFSDTLLQGLHCMAGAPVFFSPTGAWLGGQGCRKQ